jgi:GT2 family glycosyltransferase
MKKILLVVPVHNRLNELRELLASLCSLDIGGLELLVTIVDDASKDPIPETLNDNFPGLKLQFIRLNENIGPASARNLALKDAVADYYWFLDSDSEIDDPNVLKHMVSVLESYADVGAVGGVVELVDEKWMVFESVSFFNTMALPQYLKRDDYQETFVSNIPTANMLISMEIFSLTGSFDEQLVRDEDHDLCMALRKDGYKIFQSQETMVRHKLSHAGRDSGAFAHFQDRKKFLSDLLKTKSILIYKHNKWKLFVLPFLDVLTLFQLCIASKKYNIKVLRFNLINKKKKISDYLVTVLLISGHYIYGLMLLLRLIKR